MGFYGIDISNTENKTTSYTSALSSQRSYSPYYTNIFDEVNKSLFSQNNEEKDLLELLLEQIEILNALSKMPMSYGATGYGAIKIDTKKLESKYSPLIEKYAQKYDVNADVAKAMTRVESGFNPNATSKCGAMGLMQLMPDTAKSMGVKNPYDPEQNIEGGIKYLSKLLKRYGGDYRRAVAAYNGGMGNIERKGIDFCTETSKYHRKVLGNG